MVGASFLLQDLETGRVIAYALLSAEARYATMISAGQTRLERQFATSFQWLLIEEQLARRLDDGPLHRNSAIVALLVDSTQRTSIIVQHLVSTPFDDDPDHAVEVLDAHLTDFATMSMLPMSSE